jgi:hypothetical protein
VLHRRYQVLVTRLTLTLPYARFTRHPHCTLLAHLPHQSSPTSDLSHNTRCSHPAHHALIIDVQHSSVHPSLDWIHLWDLENAPSSFSWRIPLCHDLQPLWNLDDAPSSVSSTIPLCHGLQPLDHPCLELTLKAALTSTRSHYASTRYLSSAKPSQFCHHPPYKRFALATQPFCSIISSSTL